MLYLHHHQGNTVMNHALGQSMTGQEIIEQKNSNSNNSFIATTKNPCDLGLTNGRQSQAGLNLYKEHPLQEKENQAKSKHE